MIFSRKALFISGVLMAHLAACGGSDAPVAAGGAGTSGGSAGGVGRAGAPSGGAASAGLPSGAGTGNAGASLGGGSSVGGAAGASGAGGAVAGSGGALSGVAGAAGSVSGGAGAAGSVSGGAGSGQGGGASGGTGGGTTLPAKIVAGYYPNWTESPVRIKDVNSHYNLIYLFAAQPVGGAPGTTGALNWTMPGNGRGAASNFNADIAYARGTQGRKIILSIGGANNGMSFPNRTKSQAFVDSVVSWYEKFGGFDGIDWNTFEGNQAPDTSEMIWISLELKKHYPGFIISAPPAPWNSVDKTFCSTMVKAGALDYAAPQYYDGPNLATQSYIVTSVAEWVTLLGASKVVVGFGIWDQPNYMAIADALKTWNAVEAANPALRGAFDWQIHTDEAQGWPFATQLGPLVP